MNLRIFYLVIFLKAFPVFTDGQCLQAYLPFNGNTIDESGNGQHAINSGAILTTDRFGNPDSAYEFDGISSYIELDSDYDFPERTISLWANAYDIIGAQPQIFISDNPSLSHGFTQIRAQVIDMDSFFGTSAGVSSANTIAYSPITMNSWHMLTISVGADSIRHYFDCELILTTPVGSYTSPDGHSKALLGTSRSFNRFFKGKIDDVRIYNCAFDQNQISRLCSEITSIKDSSLEFTIYPNPTDNFIFIDGIQDFNNYKIAIYNILGEKIDVEIDSQNRKIDVSRLNSGFYFLSILNKKGVNLLTKKVFISAKGA